jgi:beta-lactamase regulating signal transducer with metallopeptidase domain
MRTYPIVRLAERNSFGPRPQYLVAVMVVLLVVLLPQPVRPQGAAIAIVNVEELAKGYSLRKLTGSTVVNDQNQKVGTIDDFIVGRDRVLFAVLGIGGFLHLGAHLVGRPYSSLELDDTGSKIVLHGAMKHELKKLPEFKPRS